ncbi:TPA: hypothetical protein NH725_004760 [Pseudomonas aeruginosa]|nr:hypothetical protein [Pseudomonas aeruginosa]
MFQKQVYRQYTPGFPGDLIEDGPKRARPGRIMALASVTPAATATGPNRISRAFGYAGDVGSLGEGQPKTVAARASEVVVGGATFFGILGHPKHYALYGSAGDSLAPSYDLPDGSEGEFFDMATGLVVEIFNGAATALDLSYGDPVAYVPNNLPTADNALGLPAGALVGFKAGSMPTGLVQITNARIVNAISLPAQSAGNLVAGVTIVQLTQ